MYELHGPLSACARYREVLMTQIGMHRDRHPHGCAAGSARAPVLFASGALVLAAFGLLGACSGVETSDTGSTGTTSGVDCSNVGCGAPPLCSTGCQETCGCCS